MNNGKHSQEYLKRWCEQEGDKRLVAGANIDRRDTHANFPDAASKLVPIKRQHLSDRTS